MKSKAMVKSSGEMHKKWLLVLVIFDALENLLSLMILYDQCLATLMRALSTCDKQNLCNGGGEPQEKKKTFESMNSALYVHIDSELKYLLVHEF